MAHIEYPPKQKNRPYHLKRFKRTDVSEEELVAIENSPFYSDCMATQEIKFRCSDVEKTTLRDLLGQL